MVACAALSKRLRGSQGLVLRTSAKVNLALEVLGKRGDGYHEIATVLQAVDLFDRLTVDPDETLSLNTDDPAMFGCNLVGEYRRAAAELGFSQDELRRIGANGFRYAFSGTGKVI